MRQKRLFPFPELETFDTAAALLRPAVVPLIWKGIFDAIDDFSKRRHDDPCFQILTDGQAAQFLHPQIVHRLKVLISDFIPHDANWFEHQGLQVFNFQDRVWFSVKKLDHDLKRSNAPTEHNTDFWKQSSANEKPIALLAGYVPSANWSHANVYLTLPNGENVDEWELIGNQLAAFGTLANARTQSQRSETEKGFNVRPKKDADRKKKADGEDVG